MKMIIIMLVNKSPQLQSPLVFVFHAEKLVFREKDNCNIEVIFDIKKEVLFVFTDLSIVSLVCMW